MPWMLLGIKAATAANAREAPAVSSGNRRRPPFHPISSWRKLEPPVVKTRTVFPPWSLLISSPPQLCACPVLLVLRTRATTPLTGFALPSLANLALTILSWLLHRSVGYIFCVSMTFIPSVFRTAASPAMVWCLVVTMQTLPQTANSTASASRTRSARTPSTRSTSSAPTAPSSTSSSSTATGGQCVFSPS